MAQQRLDEARDTVAHAHAHKLDDFVVRLALYGLDFLKADDAGMNAQLQWLADRPDPAFNFSLPPIPLPSVDGFNRHTN